MDWMHTEYVFCEKRAVLHLPSHDLPGAVRALLSAVSDDPVKLEAALRNMVLEYQPQLIGCVIHFMRYSYSTQAWEIGVSHEKLPPVAWGQESPQLRLRTVERSDEVEETPGDWFRRLMR